MFTVKVPRRKAFEFFLDPQQLAKCLPDLQELKVKSKDEFDAKVKVGISFIRGVFNFNFKVVERKEPEHARLKAHGAGLGSVVDLDTTIDLSDADGGTQMKWWADAKVGGTLAAVGQRLLEGQSKKTIDQLFANIKTFLEK